MGPIENYPSPRAITGRAGLYPSRYQSNKVDIANLLCRPVPFIWCNCGQAKKRVLSFFIALAQQIV
jgi:hypothetical protein